MLQKDIDRFLSKLTKQPNGCWEYIGAKDADGYGMFWFNGRTIGAHRFSIEYLANQPLNKGNQTCHSCDNPCCCNPNHLFIGSTQDNTADRHRKGRTATGSQIGTSTYSECDILKVKQAFCSRPHYRGIIKDLSKEFSISYAVVWNVCRNKGWRHI